MLEPRFAITRDFNYDILYLFRVESNATSDNPCGDTWGSFDTFKSVQRAINCDPLSGTITAFDSYVDAEEFCNENGIENFVIRQFLFDVNDGEKADMRFCTPGMSSQALDILCRK